MAYTHTDTHHTYTPIHTHSPISILYLCGCLASSIMGMMLVLFLATLIRSLPERWENSTAYTSPSWTCRRQRVTQDAAHQEATYMHSVMHELTHTHTHAHTHTAIKLDNRRNIYTCTCIHRDEETLM